MIIFITGGARSGKSNLADKMAKEQGGQICYIATAQALDVEMEDRINRHKKLRPTGWMTIEEPINLLQAVEKGINKGADTIIIDCLTLWITNLISEKIDVDDPTSYGFNSAEKKVLPFIEHTIKKLKAYKKLIIIVSNELGSGIVPENKLGRIFRDLMGLVNKEFANISDKAYITVSGIPIKLK